MELSSFALEIFAQNLAHLNLGFDLALKTISTELFWLLFSNHYLKIVSVCIINDDEINWNPLTSCRWPIIILNDESNVIAKTKVFFCFCCWKLSPLFLLCTFNLFLLRLLFCIFLKCLTKFFGHRLTQNECRKVLFNQQNKRPFNDFIYICYVLVIPEIYI